ncbi:hypothetical protein, partial [Massilia aquatica]|uniref:hypothetical protein n=1 Tax=Massilia aquatica TaxID=2609000 RepID=UPI001A7EE23B
PIRGRKLLFHSTFARESESLSTAAKTRLACSAKKLSAAQTPSDGQRSKAPLMEAGNDKNLGALT